MAEAKIDASALDLLGPSIEGRPFFRTTAPARAEPGLFRFGRGREKGNARATRPPTRAGRTAIDARRLHGVNELSVSRAIARGDGTPPCARVERFGLLRGRLHHGAIIAETAGRPLSDSCAQTVRTELPDHDRRRARA